MITQAVKDEASSPEFLLLPDGRRLAYRLTPGTLPGIVFMGGFRSDMNGAKAFAVESFCREEGMRCLRFDYSGHGQSSGEFLDCTIGGWKSDALAMLDQVAIGPNILVGSSMGAWIALLAARERSESVVGLAGIASAPDFTEALIWHCFNESQQQQLLEEGMVPIPSCYGQEPYPITRQLIEEARGHLLLKDGLRFGFPVRLVHGTLDEDVPWQMSSMLMERIVSPDISLELVKEGDHRLSQPTQIAVMLRALEELVEAVR